MNIIKDNLFGIFISPAYMADYFILKLTLSFKRKVLRRLVTMLSFKVGKINTASQNSCGCTCFETSQRKSKIHKAFCKLGCGKHTVRTALIRNVTDKDFSA